MATKSKIEWTETTWNPVTGCTKVSQGCKFCYAETIAERFRGEKAFPNGFDLQLRPDRLEDPLKWRKPRLVFVNSMSDLFHKDIPEEFIRQVFDVMVRCPQHTFQVLTKRAERLYGMSKSLPWPPNVWMGVSVENEEQSYRIGWLQGVPAKVRFLSLEPLLGPVEMDLDGIHWVIVGGESGPGARLCNPLVIRSILAHCELSKVPVFVKQMGTDWAKFTRAKHPKGGDPSEWPPEFRVRQMPEAYHVV